MKLCQGVATAETLHSLIIDRVGNNAAIELRARLEVPAAVWKIKLAQATQVTVEDEELSWAVPPSLVKRKARASNPVEAK